MAPFHPQPRPEVRQAAYGVTLTVIRASTTYTTFVTLAPGDPTTDVLLTTTTGSSLQTSITATTTTTSTTSSTTTLATSTPTTYIGAAPTSGPSNGVVVGAILGSFFGFCILFIILWWCCYNGYNPCLCWWYDDSDSDSYDSSYGSGSSRTRIRVRAQRRGGWTGGYVRRPDRARVRVRRESVTTTTRSGSRSRIMLERRKAQNDKPPLFGFMYFGLDGTPRSALVNERRYERRRESVVGRGFRVDD